MHPNIVEFQISGDYALFSDPITRVGGEKFSYQIPTYEAMKGIMQSIYWKPTIIWIIDKVRVMNPIQTETKGIRTLLYQSNGSKRTDLSYYTYLKDVKYQVQAHFIWNENRPELSLDRNENKHHNIAKRMIEKGGRRDVFLGTRECQAYVESCTFGEEIDYGVMYHGITYADEAYSEETKGKMTVNLWHAAMKNGVIEFPLPQNTIHRPIKDMSMKEFGKDKKNFIGIDEFGEEED